MEKVKLILNKDTHEAYELFGITEQRSYEIMDLLRQEYETGNHCCGFTAGANLLEKLEDVREIGYLSMMIGNRLASSRADIGVGILGALSGILGEMNQDDTEENTMEPLVPIVQRMGQA